MKALVSLVSVLLAFQALAAGTNEAPAAAATAATPVHRYMVERTFPAGALQGLDAATKAKVNANNASVGVRWVQSYATADETKTFCVYEGPSEAAVREAAKLNALPVDSVTEVPVDLTPRQRFRATVDPAKTHRFLVMLAATATPHRDTFGARDDPSGVRWITTYASADKSRTYGIYEGATEAAVRHAARASGVVINRVTEVPVTLTPR
jgi:hypothetical protein